MGKSRAWLRGGETRLLWAAAPAGGLLLAVLIFAVWQFAQVGRSLDGQALLSRAAFAQHDRLLQMLNEESGVRGYVATGDPVYLQIYDQSQDQWERDASVVVQTQTVIPQLQQSVQRSISAAHDVQEYFRREIAFMRSGDAPEARRDLSQGKMLFDRLRLVDMQVQQAADMQLSMQREHTRLLARMGLTAGIAVCGILAAWIVVFGLVVRLSKKYRLSSMRDPLTGALNRLGAIAALDAQAGASHPQSFGLIFVDLDGFKKINDVYGHATGDALLCAVAQRLETEVRTGDSVCRLGGDEFVCVIAAPASTDDVRAIAQRLRRTVCQPYEIGDDSYVVGCSIGVSMYPQHGTTAESLLARADSAMYAAKAGGGGVREATAVAHWNFSS
jgi:diguanylate cyclase (GGDEF)-like protein